MKYIHMKWMESIHVNSRSLSCAHGTWARPGFQGFRVLRPHSPSLCLLPIPAILRCRPIPLVFHAMDAPMRSQEDDISPQIKAEFEGWGTETMGGVLAGMLYGGVREAASAAKMEQSRLPFPHEDKLKPKGKIIREMTENKVLRIARGTVLGGAKLGAFVALFSGVQHGLAVHRNAHDTINTVAAGAITGGSFSFTLPGSLLTRLSSAALGTILGGSVALPLGWLQSTLQAELNPVQEQGALHLQFAEASRPKPKYEEGQGVDEVIRRLESRVPEPALRSPE